MERDEIERHDFPAVRRGYDPAAVDAHLRRVADELERRPASLAQNTSAQVKTIIEAAETSARRSSPTSATCTRCCSGTRTR
jgi:DivIVA domain-containing protein